MIFKQETIKTWFTGINSSVNNEVIKPFQNAEQVIWKYNQAIEHNSLTQKGWERLLVQSDDGLKAYLTNIKGTTASMTDYTVSLQGNITGFKKVSSAITQYNALATSGTQKQNEFSTAVSVTNTKLGSYLIGLNGTKASLGGYVLSLVGATAKTIALQFATIALNSAITMGASLIISGIVSAISSWIHKTENMISASEDALDQMLKEKVLEIQEIHALQQQHSEKISNEKEILIQKNKILSAQLEKEQYARKIDKYKRDLSDIQNEQEIISKELFILNNLNETKNKYKISSGRLAIILSLILGLIPIVLIIILYVKYGYTYVLSILKKINAMPSFLCDAVLLIIPVLCTIVYYVIIGFIFGSLLSPKELFDEIKSRLLDAKLKKYIRKNNIDLKYFFKDYKLEILKREANINNVKRNTQTIQKHITELNEKINLLNNN